MSCGVNGANIALKLGLECLLEHVPARYQGRPAGLLAHAASCTAAGQQAVTALAQHPDVQLKRLFSPEHGFSSQGLEGQAIADSYEAVTGLPIISLYGQRRRPHAEHLRDLDLLFFDVQDVGVRAFTYIATLKACLQACAEASVTLLVLDRPNPLGRGSLGAGREEALDSFVAPHNLRFIHGMTIAEVALQMARDMGCEAWLETVNMQGWQGESWEATGLPWRAPSPALQRLAQVHCYPATVFVEGCNLSEGRGTEVAFECLGAPWLDAQALADDLNGLGLSGVRFQPVSFTATRSKHAGQQSQGVRLELHSRADFNPLHTAYRLLRAAYQQNPGRFQWLQGEGRPHPFVDMLFGSAHLRQAVEGKLAEAEFFAYLAQGEQLETKRPRFYP